LNYTRMDNEYIIRA